MVKLRTVFRIVFTADIGSGHSQHYVRIIHQNYDRKHNRHCSRDRGLSFYLTILNPSFKERNAVGKEVE